MAGTSERPDDDRLLSTARRRTVEGMSYVITIVLCITMLSGCAQSQSHTPPAAQSAQAPAAPSPATKMEAFKPAAGSVVTLGYDDLGKVRGISVDVREMRDAKGNKVRGLVVDVMQSEYRRDRSFVDADEIPELLKGFDALLEVKDNPTQFKNFEVRYTTKGDLQLVAFNSLRTSTVLYSVKAGRALAAEVIGLDASDMQKLRGLFQTASEKLAALPQAK
jgi:hypothetical protein